MIPLKSHPARARTRLAVAVTMTLLVGGLAGCDGVPIDTSSAEREIREFRVQIDKTTKTLDSVFDDVTDESREWRPIVKQVATEIAELRNGKGRLASAAAEFMEEGITQLEGVATLAIGELREATGASIQDLGAETRLTLRLLEARTRSLFDAIAEGIDQYERELAEGGGEISPDRFMVICRELVAERPVTPMTAAASPRSLTIDWRVPDRQAGFTLRQFDRVCVSGVGFQHPEAAASLRVRLSRGQETPATHELAPRSLTINSDYLLTIRPSLQDLAALVDAEEIQVLWDDKVLHHVPIHWFRRPVLPPGDKLQIAWSMDGSAVTGITTSDGRPFPGWNPGMPPTRICVVGADLGERDVDLGPMGELELRSIDWRRDDRGLRCLWEGRDIESGSLTFNLEAVHSQPKSPSTKRIYLRVLGIDIYNRGYLKDEWSVGMSLSLFARTHEQLSWTHSGITDDALSDGLGPDGHDTTYTRYFINQTSESVEMRGDTKVGLLVSGGEARLSPTLRKEYDTPSLALVYDLDRARRAELIPISFLVFSRDEGYGLKPEFHTFGPQNTPAHRMPIYDTLNPGGLAAYVYFTLHEAAGRPEEGSP